MEQLQMELNSGDICIVDFNPAKGGEIGKQRPAIIMSKKEENQILDTVIVIPLSTVIEKNSEPYRYHIKSRENLQKDSDACIYEIRALSKNRVKEKVATLYHNELENIKNCLCKIIL